MKSNDYFIISRDNVLLNYIGEEKNVVIPDSVKSIGQGAFSDANSIVSVIIPNSVTSIKEGAFEDCKNLETIVIPDSVDKVPGSMFRRCSNLKNVSIGKNVSSIGSLAFCRCTSLEDIELPEGLELIGDNCFTRCTNLKSINLPKSLKSIGDNAFYFCDNLNNIILPEGLTEIKRQTFSYCANLKNVKISSSVKVIRFGAFEFCSNLESIIIPKSVESIEVQAFSSSGLKSIVIENKDCKFFSNCFDMCLILETIQICDVVYNVKNTPFDAYKDGIDLSGEYKLHLIANCLTPEKLLDTVYNEELLHKLIKYCNNNSFYENQIYFTNYLYSHYKSGIDTVIKKKLSFDDIDKNGETSLF